MSGKFVPEQGTLRVLSENRLNGDVDILLVPGIGTSPTHTWSFCSPWLDSYLRRLEKTARVLTFTYQFPIVDSLSWENIWLQGDQLLRSLVNLRSSYGASPSKTPIICVGHSLGGLILKQALCIATEQSQHYEQVNCLLNSIAGLLFLSSPHFGAHNGANSTEVVVSILKSNHRALSQIRPATLQDVSILTNLSARFEAARLQVPVLSLFELKETKIREGLLKSKHVIIVDKERCTTLTSQEQFLGLQLDHDEMCRFNQYFQQTRDTNHVESFICTILDDAEVKIAERLKAATYDYATTTSYSPISRHNSPDEELFNVSSLGQNVNPELRATNEATRGSGSSESHAVAAPLPKDEVHTRQIQLPCHMLEAQQRNIHFTGREKVLTEVESALLPTPSNAVFTGRPELRRFAICGLGGVGKTEVAFEFALRHRGAYDAIFWVRADEPSKMENKFSEISVQLRLESSTQSTNPVVSRELVKGWLQNPVKHSSTSEIATWLIIFDNADNPYFLLDYWPIHGCGSILITSRNPLVKALFATEPSGIDLDSFNDADGAALVKSIAADAGDRQAAEQISRILGGLPLALTQMANIIKFQGLQLSEFLQSYEDASERSTFFEMEYRDGNLHYPHTVASVWAMKSLKPTTLAFLRVLAFLDPDSIQEKLLANPPEGILLDDYPRDTATLQQAYTELVQASLVKRRLEQGDLIIHRLVQDSVIAGLTPEDFTKAYWTAVQLVWNDWPSAMAPPTRKGQPAVIPKTHFLQRWPQCASLYPHALKLKARYSELPALEMGVPLLVLASLLNDAAWWQFERGRAENFNGFWDISLEICRNIKGNARDSLVVDIHFALGAIESETNQHESARRHKLQSLELALAIQKRVETPDIRLSRAYSEWGVALIQAGEYDAAEENIATRRQIDKTIGAYSFNWNPETNLGLAYILKGDLDASESVLSPLLRRREELYGKDDRESFRPGRILHAMGNLRMAQNLPTDGFHYHQRALATFAETVGKKHHRYADMAFIMAEHHLDLGQNESALNFVDEALLAWQVSEDVYKQEIARATFLKAAITYKDGKHLRARILRRRACALLRVFADISGKPDEEIVMDDFTRHIAFWSK